MSTPVHAYGPPSSMRNTPVHAYRAQIYGALSVMVIVPALCILGNQAGLLRIVFPLLSVAVGGLLYWRSKPLYVGFVCWLWFLSPFVRRMADFQSGWRPTSAVLVAPYLVAGISGLALLGSLQRLGEPRLRPYVCALVGIAYGAIIGFARFPLFNVLQALLNWIVPVIFGLFLYLNRDLYAEFRRVIDRSFLVGMLLMGAYGIYQYFALPEWDRIWMLNVQMNSFGKPEATQVRIFSTMNAPAIFAAVTACGLLLLLLNVKGKLWVPAAACGLIALILTMSRASWLSLVAGVIYLITQAETRQRIRLVVAIGSCVVFLVAFSQIPVVNDLVSQRIQTFSDPSHDVSYAARIEGHQEALRGIAQEPFGEGIGSTDTEHGTEGDDDMIGPHDSTILEFLYSLGWIGTLIYAVGLGALAFQLIGSGKDPFALSSKAILIGFATQCLLNSVMLGVLGFMVWTFASLTLAQKDMAEQLAIASAPEEPDTTRYAAA